MAKYTPGMRVLIRDEEWIIKKVNTNSIGGKTIYVTGITQLVKDKEAIFLDTIDNIEEVNPEDTKLVIDNSTQFIKSKLFIESHLRSRVPTDRKRLYFGHKAAMNTVPYQLDPAFLALEKPRQRILIADAVGLGKTLEAGILMSELIARGKGKRILVVTVKSMMTQFQKEMWNRFTIPLERLDSAGIQKIRNKIPSNHNPFYYFDKVIISMDTLKRDIEYRVNLENSYWDIIVIDEAHNVARRGESQAQRSRLASLLSEKSDTLIMLSATPHDGKPRSFASLMNMLDPTAIANEDEYTKEDIKGMCIRRFKKDIQDQVEGAFKERKIYTEYCQASSKEEEAFDFFANMKFNAIDKNKSGSQLFKTTLEKALFSSPVAGILTIHNRLKKLEGSVDKNIQEDANKLKALKKLLVQIDNKNFSRYAKLIELLKRKDYEWSYKNTKDRVVIFTERIETMRFLGVNLHKDLGIPENAIQTLYGGMSDVDQQKIVDDFGRDDSPVRILVASDVASEGINLHYLSHRLIHFDIPWSLMVFQQRNGRIDRYGQENIPDIRYLISKSINKKIKGDTRVLEILIQKEEQAVKNIGDPAALMNVYDQELEEEKTAQAMENDKADEFEKMLSDSQNEPDLLAMMLASMEEPEKEDDNRTVDTNTMFSDYDYLKMSLSYLSESKHINFRELNFSKGLDLELTKELKERLINKIPADAMPSNDILVLNSDKKIIEEEIRKSRQEKIEGKAWPKVHYLWTMHPIFDWINDKSKTIFSRKEAPVIHLPSLLDEGEYIFVVSGVIPNRKSQPMIDEWLGLRFKDSKLREVISLEEVLERTKIGSSSYPNRGILKVESVSNCEKLISEVVKSAKQQMTKRYEEFESYINPMLQEELDKLEALKGKHYQQLSLIDIEKKKDEKKRKVDELFDNFFDWMEDTMTLEKDAHIEIVSVFVGG